MGPVALSLALVLSAQSQSSGHKSHNAKGNRITVTGCLQAGTEPNTYVLNNAMGVIRGKSGKTPSQMARTEDTYKLVPEGNLDLKSHVGHKVEVTGMEEMMGSSSAGSMRSESSSSSGAESGMNAPELRVSKIRHISDTCQ
jgi:hypothetical protein